MSQAVILDEGQKFLKYLFVVRFEDGTVYEQNEADKAVIAEKGSCFSDVLKLSEKSPVEQAVLTDGEDLWHLDLRTGDFTHTTNFSYMGPEGVETIQKKSTIRIHDRDTKFYNKRLIIFRRRYIDWIDGVETVDESKVQYAFGWQANVSPDPASENKQFIQFID
jgi:hypothetical protein